MAVGCHMRQYQGAWQLLVVIRKVSRLSASLIDTQNL
jgi:hypothetical protein